VSEEAEPPAEVAPVEDDVGDLKPGDFNDPISEQLRASLTSGWSEPSTARLDQTPVAPYCAKRRRALSERFAGDRIVVPCGQAQRRANDQDHRYRAGSDYVYLTGDQSQGAVLVLEPAAGGHEAVLFTRIRGSRSDTSFFDDARHGELWVGARRTAAQMSDVLGLECRALAELTEHLARAFGGDGTTRVLRGLDPAVDGEIALSGERGDAELAAVCSELRLIKDEHEIAEIELAVAITTRGFEDVARLLLTAQQFGERLVEGVFEFRSRLEGNGIGYNTIAAAGPHATKLHWNRNDGPLSPGDLLLLDAGAETRGLYTADITRTIPINGRFSPLQRQIYQVVYEAQEAALAEVAPGKRFRDYYRASAEVLARGLQDLGALSVPAAESLSRSGLHRRFTLCSPGHMLGLDVHDCARARAATYLDGVLEAGNVLTVEPGLYFQADDETIAPELRGIGVRIEDDVLVTDSGARLLSDGLPRHPDEVERWVLDLMSSSQEGAGSFAMRLP
jgi:Xaa-Pro aminopeptidase